MPVKRNQSKEPGDMFLSSKIGIVSIKHHIWCREMIQGFLNNCLDTGQIYKEKHCSLPVNGKWKNLQRQHIAQLKLKWNIY